MYKHVYTMYSTCAFMYIQFEIHGSCQLHGIYNVYTHTSCFSIHDRVHNCIALVHVMHIPCTYLKCTKTYSLVHVLEKQKFARWGN